MARFLAIDFETANRSRTSACAVGLVYVRDRRVVAEESFLIRPPQRQFEYTHIHHLTWEDVKSAPTFSELWPVLQTYIDRADYLVAHNAAFDQGVLRGCCETYCLPVPECDFICTVQLARRQWGVYPTKLPDVCRHLGIPLRHHNAASDARACAEILLQAQREGWHYG